MKRVIAFLALAGVLSAGVGTGKAVYLGGTVSTVRAGAQGEFDLANLDVVIYHPSGSPELRIPYGSITSIEYGQKAGRRVGAAIATAILVSPVGLALLLSHKRKHILTIGWNDGHNQAAIFEVGKNAIRPVLATLEARTGKKIEYESEDARKNIGR